MSYLSKTLLLSDKKINENESRNSIDVLCEISKFVHGIEIDPKNQVMIKKVLTFMVDYRQATNHSISTLIVERDMLDALREKLMKKISLADK